MPKFEPREGWWFSSRELILPYGDGRPVVIGEKISVKGKLIICRNALHGSYDPLYALQYAPGPMLHKVLFTGARIEESGKLGSRSRTVLASRDAEAMLWHFARRQALTVAANWQMPDVVRRYLETGDENLRSAAWSAAWSAAQNAAWSAAQNAVRSAAQNAVRSAARSAAESAAESAAWSAAWSAAESAAWSAAQNAVRSAARSAAESAAESAARSAARSAAWSAAWSAARQMFGEMVAELFKDEQ